MAGLKSYIRPVSITPFFTQPEENNTDEQRNQSASARPVNTGVTLQNDRQVSVPKIGQAQKRVTIDDWLNQYYPKVDLSKDIRKAERERKQHLFGNVATVLGQGLGSLLGARQFTQVQNNDPYYLQRIDQLRNQQRAYDADWAKNRFNILYNDYKAEKDQERANELAKSQFAYNAALKQIDAANDIAKENRAWERKGKELEFNAGENQKKRDADMALAKYKEAAATQRNRENQKATTERWNTRYGSGSGSNKGAVAYSSKYGNIWLDNANNKKALTLRALSMMKDDPNTEFSEQADIISLINGINSGDTNTLYKAEQYVSEHIDDDEYINVWDEMVKYADRYGHVDYYDPEEEGWSLTGEGTTEEGWSLK